MSNSTYKHLTIDDRKIIESSLNNPDIKLKSISSQLGKSDKAIRNDIVKHRYVRIRSNQHNKCGKQLVCDKKRLCTHCINGLCKGCKHDNCNALCDDFVSFPTCKRVTRFPYVCSGCRKIDSCKSPKYFYNSQVAQSQYETDKRTWREGPKLDDNQLRIVSEVLEKGIKNNQSIDVIVHTNDIPISTSTAYRYIKKRHIAGVINLDLKRAVKYAPRSNNKVTQVPINYDFLEGRRYKDFEERVKEDALSNIWEMDTVLGPKGKDEKCALSLLHRKSNLQLYFLINHREMLEVNKVFDAIKSVLAPELFKETFTIILTDKGSEFFDPLSIETDPNTGEKLISVYYCEPRRSDEKGKCEKNHEHFRELVPKGSSINSFTKHDMNHISNMVNNYARKMFQYHSPFEVASTMLHPLVLKLNRLHFINPIDVCLKPYKK